MLYKTYLCLLIPCIAFSQVKNPWEQFIVSPNGDTFVKCDAQIAHSIPLVSDRDSTITLIQVSRIEDRFLGIVMEGNPFAMELCFKLYRIFPPGYAADREYFNGALGMSATRSPGAFLRLLSKYEKLDPYFDGTSYVDVDVGAITVGVSPQLLDNMAGKREEYRQRLSAILCVRDSTHIKTKNKCVMLLKEAIESLDTE